MFFTYAIRVHRTTGNSCKHSKNTVM